jgi:hypothetical protein
MQITSAFKETPITPLVTMSSIDLGASILMIIASATIIQDPLTTTSTSQSDKKRKEPPSHNPPRNLIRICRTLQLRK